MFVSLFRNELFYRKPIHRSRTVVRSRFHVTDRPGLSAGLNEKRQRRARPRQSTDLVYT